MLPLTILLEEAYPGVTVTVSPTHLGNPGNHLPVVSFPSIPWSPLASTAGLGDGVPATTTKKNHPL